MYIFVIFVVFQNLLECAFVDNKYNCIKVTDMTRVFFNAGPVSRTIWSMSWMTSGDGTIP